MQFKIILPLLNVFSNSKLFMLSIYVMNHVMLSILKLSTHELQPQLHAVYHIQSPMRTMTMKIIMHQHSLYTVVHRGKGEEQVEAPRGGVKKPDHGLKIACWPILQENAICVR